MASFCAKSTIESMFSSNRTFADTKSVHTVQRRPRILGSDGEPFPAPLGTNLRG